MSGGGKGAKPPKPPDPYKVAEAQTGLNRETAIAQTLLNQVNEYTPFGSSVYNQIGDVDGIPQFERTTTLSPEQQQLYEGQMGVYNQLAGFAGDQLGRVQTNLSQPFSYEGMPEAPEASEAARQQVIDALYGQHTSRLDPQFARDQQALETRLANQGITIGSEAYNAEMDRFTRGRNDAYSQARQTAIAGGGAEQSRLFGLGGAARDRAIKEAAYLRQQPLNEITALLSGGQVSLPQFTATPQTGMAPADFQGAAYQSYAGNLANWQAEQARQQAMWGTLGGLLGSGGQAAALAFSDDRLKEGARNTGTRVDGIPIKTFRWKDTGERGVGVMASDVEAKHPELVRTMAGGVKAVDYGRLFGLRPVHA